MRRAFLVALLAVVAAGCGETVVVEESPVVVTGSAPRDGDGVAQGSPDGAVRIAVVTHGQASSPFWAIVRGGVEAAARQMDVQVNYRAPEVYSLDRMRTMIRQAVASRPDGLVVSIPEEGLGPPIRRAVRAGIPVVSMNSGNDVYRELGVLAHVGQPEERAGLRAGRDGSVIAATFDLGPDVLKAVDDERLAFAVDQQPYLQGYWPIAALAQRARYGLFLGERQVVPTGPNFVTPENAARVLELSRRSIR